MRISRIEIENFRNFRHLDVAIAAHAVIVGENKIGKSNLLYALRLLLDPSLPDSARQLKGEDFWDGLPRPLTKDDVIKVSLEFADFKDDDRFLAVLGEFLISSEPMVARLSYVFGPSGVEDDEPLKESDYDFFIYGGDKPESRISSEFRRRLPMDFSLRFAMPRAILRIGDARRFDLYLTRYQLSSIEAPLKQLQKTSRMPQRRSRRPRK